MKKFFIFILIALASCEKNNKNNPFSLKRHILTPRLPFMNRTPRLNNPFHRLDIPIRNANFSIHRSNIPINEINIPIHKSNNLKKSLNDLIKLPKANDLFNEEEQN